MGEDDASWIERNGVMPVEMLFESLIQIPRDSSHIGLIIQAETNMEGAFGGAMKLKPMFAGIVS